MSKSNLVRWNELRQGQTVYSVHADPSTLLPTVEPRFLYSHKEIIPPRGYIIERLPVDHAITCSKNYGIKFYRKRCYAEREAKRQLGLRFLYMGV